MNVDDIRSRLNGRKIGVVVPSHNYGRYLEKCLRSILDQSLLPDRIVVIDDASTDDTAEVSQKFQGQILYRQVEFKHANKTRNYGISLIPDCEFILLFDADNYMLPTMVQHMINYLLENPDTAFAYCDRINIDDNGITRNRTIFPEYNAKIFESNNFVDFASMIHRKVYDGVGGLTEDDAFSALEDWDFFYAAANLGFHGIHIPEALYKYRYHKTSKSIYLKEHPLEYEKLKRHILVRNCIGYANSNPAKSVSFVFAARTEAEAQATILEYNKQRYIGAVEFCYSTNGNIAHAMNEALAKAKHEIVVFIETDTVPVQGDWVDMLLEGIERGKMMFSREVSHTYFNWAGAAVYKDDLGGLQIDEQYPIAEDTEYFERLKRDRGIQLCRSDAAILHLKDHESQKALDRAFVYGYLHAKLIDKYKYFSLASYVRRLEVQKQIAEETLAGIKQYEDDKTQS